MPNRRGFVLPCYEHCQMNNKTGGITLQLRSRRIVVVILAHTKEL